MAEASPAPIDFRTAPDRYRHWKLSTRERRRHLTMDVNEDGGLRPGYELKLNSYDLGVDIELYDAVQRLRFEHPEVGAVVVTGGDDTRVLRRAPTSTCWPVSTHAHKVNFCKFTNETRNAHRGRHRALGPGVDRRGQRHRRRRRLRAGAGLRRDPAGRRRLQRGVAARGAAARRAARHRRPDAAGRQAPGAARPRRLLLHHAPRACKGQRARRVGAGRRAGRRASSFAERCAERAEDAPPRRPARRTRPGIALHAARAHDRGRRDRATRTSTSTIDRARGAARHHGARPARPPPPATPTSSTPQGAAFWPLALARELDDAILHLRFNEPEIGTWVLRTAGRRRRRGRGRRRAARQHADALAGARDPALLEAHAEAARRVSRARSDRAGRAGQLLRRHAARAGAGRRPLLHARRHAARATGRAGDAPADRR